MTTLFPPSQPVPAARREQIQNVILDACGDTQAWRSRELRQRPRLVFSGVGMAVALTGVAVASLLLFSGEARPPALAAWTAVPQSVSPAQAVQLTRDCTARVVGHFPISLGRVTSSLAEHRGSSSAVLIAGSTGSEAICVNPATSANGSSGGYAGTQAGIVAADPMVGSLKVDGGTGGPAVGLTTVFGRVTDRATTVKVTAEDGRVVTASVGHGYFLAWWPSGSPAGTVRALDDAGHVIATAGQPAAATGGVPVPRRSS